MRQALKKLTALLLSIAMVLSLFTDILPAAYADEGGVSAPTTGTEVEKDYDDIVTTRQPGLYVDFLGDNRNYLQGRAVDTVTGIAVPGSEDQNAETNNNGVNTWKGYQRDEQDAAGNSLYGDLYSGEDTIFWVGVGIDKMDELDLFTQGSDGIYSLELGFYYNSTFIEPYTGLTGVHTDKEVQEAYEQVIANANLKNYDQYRWEDFRIVSAETGLRPQTDVVTQEVIAGPDMDTILGPDDDELEQNNWRMTYVAIERDPTVSGAKNRSFTSQDPQDPEEKTKYLLIIPFRLKAFDSRYQSRLCLRLVRNAGMFSIGGGEDGSSPYAAWERVTTRNPGRELKLMANFRGDLNIFNGKRVRDELYNATLVLDNGGGTDNTAVLSVDGDPSKNGVSVNEDGQKILNLPGGTGMKVDVTLQTGYEVTVRVYPEADKSKPEDQRTYFPCGEVWDNDRGTYTFVMPNIDVIVEVIFGIKDNIEFNLYLDEDHTGEDPVVKPDGKVKGNGTVLTAEYPGNPVPPAPRDPETVTVDKDSPADNSLNLPREKVKVEKSITGINTKLTVDVALHADYYAEVEIYNVANKQTVLPTSWTGDGISVISGSNRMMVPYGGQLILEAMPQSDVIVRVRYLPAQRVTAKLEVWHENTAPKDTNVAQLRTMGYDDNNEGMYAYSGVVYDNDKVVPEDHSAVKDPFRVLPMVEAQAALLSGSLGGDGNTPVPWLESIPDGAALPQPDPESILALLYGANTPADFANKLHAYDLRNLTDPGLTKGPGLRKNAKGEFYTDSEMTQAYQRLLEIQALAKKELQDMADAGASTTPSGVEKVDVTGPDPADSTKTKLLFSYYKLTPDQVQAYLLDYERDQEEQEQYRKDLAQYNEDYQKYLDDVAAGVTPAPTPPTPPTAPAPLTLRTAAGAKAELAKYTWYDPSVNHDTRPPTGLTPPPGHTIETRVGRRTAVLLESNSAYTVVGSVEILDANDRTTVLSTATRDPDHQNVYLFDMPDKDCIVKVTYKEREAHKLSLSVAVINGKDEPGNVTTVTAFAPDPDHPTAKKVILKEYRDNHTVSTDSVLEDSVVTVLVNKIPGYTVSASVVQGVLQTPVGTSPSSTTNMADGTVFTFRMPSQEAEIRITYTRDVRTNNANLLLEGERTGATGYWDGTANEMIKKSVPEGEKLKAYINVAPGYYIVSAEAYTGKGAYPFTMSGNGWNNGQGGRVELTTLMPDEEYFVRVTLARYTPPEEGTMALTLQVMDPDNEKTGMPAAYDDNNATARASGGLTLGPVGLAYGEFPTPSGSNVVVGSAEPASGWVRAGETVTVEYELQTGYVLDSIVVEPAGLGVVPTFVRGADNRVRAQFTMPAASATVVVTFRKSEEAARLFLNLNKTEDGVPATKDTQADAGNTVTWVKSETFDRNSSLLVPGTSEHRYNLTGGIPTTVPALDSAVTTGVALPGEWVTLNVRTAPGWYVHSATVTDRLGIRQNYTPGTDGTENTITFYMPSSDANVLINYRRGTAPDPTDPDDPRNSDRLLELLVLDPDNLGTGDTPVYDDNWAGAKITGAAVAAPIGPLGKARAAVRDSRYVKPGDLVTVEYSPTAGYALEIITVTAGGETLIPTYTVVPTFAAPGRATFLMPDANTTVVVRFRAVTEDDPAHRYTANLVLHPSGDDSVGVGTFDHDLNNRFYSRTALPGETIDFTAWAKDGYYIKRITVTPAVLGVSADYSGAFGLQNGSFVMPAADVQVNVFFEKLDPGKEWPQEAPYSVSLEVYDATGKGGKAHFGTIAGNALVSPDSADVGSGARKTLWDYAQGGTRVSIHERDRVFVSLEPAADTYVRSVTVTDSRGKSVPWSYVPGGVAFDMTPAHVTVTVHYARRTTEIDEGRKHRVTLHIEGASGADLAQLAQDGSAIIKDTDGDYIDGLFAGDTLTITATPDRMADPYHSVVSAYVVVDDGSGGSPVVIPTTGLLPGGAGNTTQNGMPLVAAGGQVRFAMPDADAAVYVKFLDQGIPKPDELTASLMVMGPVRSGSAIMTAAAGSGPILPPGTLPNTGTVNASGGGALFAPQRTKLTVDLTVNPGYAISSIRAVDFQGNDVPYTWKDGTQRQFTLTMPDVEGVRVYVELEKVDPNRNLTAQVVVNNGGGSGNTAKLRTGGTAGSGVAILNPVHPGEQIYLDLTVQPGYRVASIRVVPAKFGIAPSLTDKDTKNQTTSFTMPGEDVVVYVHFASDGRNRRTATLVTTGQYHENNRARIHSDFSGWSDEVSPKPSTYTNNKDTTSVMAAPATATESAEWVTVNYTWDEFNVVDYVTVTYTNGVTTVPFTQNKDLSARKGEITFPMVDANVIVTVHYKKGSELTTYEAVLHVIDMDNDIEITDVSWARLTWGSETTRDPVTGDLKAGYPFPGNVASIQVPAGQTVTVDADTVSPGVYLWAGYVIYRAGGQMIRFEFDPDKPGPGFSGVKQDTFVMHPGRNDVYVYFTKIKPEETDYSAVLMLDSPAADKKSTAKIETDGDPNQTGTVTANTDPDHAYIVATAGDTITVSVKPDAGYAVESILMTPLGVSDAAGIPIVPTQAGNNYSFTMPAQNVAIRVKLKIDSAGKYVATLHYNSADKGDGYVPLPDEVAWAILGYDTVSTNQNNGQLLVDENKQMDLSVCLNDGYLVLAAYVLQPDGTMVPLSDSLEGTTDVNKGKYDVDKAVNFRMPASDVDVYVWFTKTAPDIIWRTAVLTVTDNDGAGTVNSGLNTARFWTDTHPQATQMQIVTSGGVPTHGFFWVKEGEKVTVKIDLPYSGYVFNHPATISHSVTSAGTPTLLEDPGNAPEYVYTYNVGNCNSAVHAHFVASSITQNPLDVVVIDPDNPGGDQNTLEVSPGTLPKLTLVSSSSAGARQRVPGVTSGATVDFVIMPQPGYKTVAYLVSGGVRRQLTLTGNTGSFSMPDAPATLEVTLVKEDRAYSATLSILDTQSPVTVTTDVSVAHMTEDAFQGRVNANTGPATPPATGTEKGIFPVLPNGTGLTASVDILGTNRRIIGGVLITNQGSQALPATTNTATSVDEYKHTLNGRDAELRILVEPEPVDPNDRTYIASVTAVRLPSGVNAPTIAADPRNSLSGSSWTAAKKGNGITVTLDVPYGYRADLTVDGTDVTLSETSVDATDVTAGITGRTVEFNAPKMPARNVVVTVKYVKTRFTATITTGGNGSGKADLTATPTGGSTQKVNATGTIGDLKGGETLDFTATPYNGSEITRILMTTASGTTTVLTHTDGAGSATMPTEDVTITVIFGKKRVSSHYLDLHVSGTSGGTATLAASSGTPGSVTSTPTAPAGFSRIQAVEADSDVTLTVTPGAGYHVTLGYYLHNGSTLTYVTNTVTADAGGTATFKMPNTSTCIYVTFRAGEKPPVVPPDTPDNPDPNHYLDLHVSGTGGGSASLTTTETPSRTVSSTPANPHSVSTLKPIGTGTEVTLEVKPEPGYTAMVSYYVYNGGTPEPIVLTTIPLTGGVVKFPMPTESTCVYVTFRGPDKLPYLDLHVTNPQGGEATLATDGFGTLSSTPADPKTYSRIDQVEAGTPVKLTVTPGADYTVSVSYYRHDGGNLYYESYLIDTGNGGTASFDMPNTATCIYVAFHGPGEEPEPDPDDPEKYLDLHVAQTQGGSVTLAPDGDTPMASDPTAPRAFDQRKPVAAGTNVTLTVTPLPGYTASVSYYVHNSGTPVPAPVPGPIDSTGSTVTFTMPSESTCVYVTFKRDPNDPRKYLDLHVSGLANGSASLTADGVGTVSSTPAVPVSVSTLQPVPENTNVTLNVTPEPGYAVTVSYYVHNGGSFAYTSNTIDNVLGGTATFLMPGESTCIYVHFHRPTDPEPDPDPPDPPEPPEPELHIAYVTVVGADGEPLNAAQSIVDTTTSGLGGGTLWAYGVAGDVMKTFFTVAPGYKAKVTAKRLDTGALVTVGQQGTTGSATATSTMPAMPDADMEVIITYYRDTDPPVNPHTLTLRLVGHDGKAGNMATLKGGAADLTLAGTAAPTGANVTVSTTAELGDRLDLDANRESNYTMWATLEYTDSNGAPCVVNLPLNEYGTNGTSLLFMPDADAVVTVYYRLPYKATLFVIDAQGKDFENGGIGDTAGASAAGVVPRSTLAVTDSAGTLVGDTTQTHTPITDLTGKENTATTVDLTTLPADTAVASVIATTSSGTVNLTETAVGSGVYPFPMSTPTRAASDVDITVVLRDTTKPDPMYIATVYKVGHDNQPGNGATITNTTEPTLPAGTIWSGAYATNAMEVTVTTAPGYYAVVTAVRTGTAISVPVLQMTATGPFPATFTMPAANVDVTVTYTKTPPEAPLKLVLKGHDQKGANSAYVNDADTHILIPTLTLSGAGAASTADLQKASDSPVKAGTNLEVLTGVAPGYHVESITLTVPGLAPITLPLSAVSSAATTMPVITGGGQAVITVTIAPGQKSPRPFDPTHSTIYNGLALGGDYPTDPTLADPGNPNLSSPDQEGWILADNQSATTPGTFVVTIPTLYDRPEPDKKDTLHDAAEGDELDKRPTYTFYWKDDAGKDHPLVVGTDISVEAEAVLLPANNPSGSYPAGSTHYGYQVTLKSLIANSKLSTYLEEGGTIYVTATCTHTTADGTNWVESDQTQVILQPAKTYTATLRVVDVSSSLNNRVELTVDGDTGNVKFGVADADGEKLEKLTGKEKLRTDVTPDAQVKVVSVLAIPSKGNPSFLSPDALLGGDYPYDMTKDDVDIVVTLANEDEELYTATVVKVDPKAEPGNTVKISNRTHPTLNRSVDDKWTLAYETDAIRVDATAAPGYRAVVTAVRLDDGTALTVIPTQGGGVMVIGLVGGMPDSHVEITVTFEKVEDPNTAWVTLQMRMDDPARTLPLDPANSAQAAGTAPAGGTLTLLAEDRNGYTDTQLVAAGALALASTLAPGYQIADVVMAVNGAAETSLTPAATGFTANAGDRVTVTVLLREVPVTDRTPRPFDPAHSVEYTDATGHTGPGTHQNGYIQAANLGGSKVEIPVPNLYDGPLHAAENVKYQLYAKVGGSMVLLREGVDYDTVIPVAAAAADHHAGGKDWRGQVFTIRSLDPTGVLGDYVKKGGVIYITATAPGKTESGYTEVLLPADPDPDGYTVTLKIIDDTLGATHNTVRMQNANSGITVPWTTTGNPTDTAGSITGLKGGELIRTDVTVTAGEGVVYTVMAHSPTMGDILLSADPSGSIRYPKDMPTEDMDIIVHFRAENEHIHIAAVQKRGATAVPGNEATILNKTDWDDNNILDLNHGDIWTEGRCDKQPGGTADKIRVNVTTAEGFYATVTLSYVDDLGDPVTVTKVVLGSGNPDPLLVDFDMPDSDVQVVVLFEAGRRSPRPFDPAHAEAYQDPADTDPYKHKDSSGKNTPENVSTTDQEGWLLGENLGGGSALVTIPTLWGQEDGLENADNADFHFYLPEKDATTGLPTGNYILLEENVDYTLAHFDPTATGTQPVFTTVTNPYTYPDPAGGTSPVTVTYTGVKFRLLEIPTGKLKDLLDSGLSLYVSATKRETATPPWVEGEMTELVIPSTGLRPHDPDRVNDPDETDPTYEDHWIRAENRGDYLIVTVPQLNSPNGDAPTSADDALHRFRLHLEVKKADGTTEIVDVTDLLTITNVRGYDHPTNVNTLYDPSWTAGGTAGTPDQWEEYYENEVYNTTSLDDNGDPYNGARFIVEIDEKAADPNGLIPTLKKIFDNDGTMKSKVTGDAGDSSYRMYITSDVTDKTDDPVPDFRAMDYVDFEVPRYYRLNGMLESYAPTHIATVSLFRYDDTTGEAESAPAFVHRQFRSSGTGLWTLDFTVKSSELMGADRSGVDYQFVARKPGHVTFTWDHVKLNLDNLDPREPDRVTFTVAAVDETGNVVYEDAPANTLIQAGVIALFGGDVTGDDNVWMDDNSLIMKYLRGRVDWSTDTQKTDPDWAISVYNPESVAYRIDLNGDGYITVRDSDIWDKERNFNKNTTDYVMPQLRTSSPTVIAVMSLELPLAPDAYTVEKDTEIIAPVGPHDPAGPTPEGPDTYTVEEDTTVIHPIRPTTEDPAPDDSVGPDDPMGPSPAAPDAYTVDRDTTLVAPTPSGDSPASVPLSGKAAGDRLAIIPPRYDETEESSQKRE